MSHKGSKRQFFHIATIAYNAPQKLEQYLPALTNVISYLNAAEYFASGNIDRNIRLVRFMLERLSQVLNSRNVGGLVDEESTTLVNGKKVGSISYLLLESHSTSRRKVLTELESFIARVCQ